VERYGFSADSHWKISNLRHEGSLTRWTLTRASAAFAELSLPMAGEHNALNATAAAALAAGQGVPTDAIIEALATFKSVKRRLEVRAVVDGVTIIDDFAHHPTAIRETLRALRESYPGQRLWAVLEPRSNTLRRNVFELDLVESLALADRVVLAAVFKSESIPAPERLHPEHVVAALTRRGTPAALFADADAIVEAISPQLRGGDIVAILSNGGFGNIYQKFPNAIAAQSSTTHSA
jgi:UDP-N-acetylmuramate: L-alanyl-gamma-D-glutamyl-meso-diaminopimelate ligase